MSGTIEVVLNMLNLGADGIPPSSYGPTMPGRWDRGLPSFRALIGIVDEAQAPESSVMRKAPWWVTLVTLVQLYFGNRWGYLHPITRTHTDYYIYIFIHCFTYTSKYIHLIYEWLYWFFVWCSQIIVYLRAYNIYIYTYIHTYIHI